MTLNRDELEREIVNYDKQKLITECLKLFDSNVRLVDELQTSRDIATIWKNDITVLQLEVQRLNERTLWQVLNKRIEHRIDKIRKRKASFNYPMK